MNQDATVNLAYEENDSVRQMREKTAILQKMINELLKEKEPDGDTAWRGLYVQAVKKRAGERLQEVAEQKARQLNLTKKYEKAVASRSAVEKEGAREQKKQLRAEENMDRISALEKASLKKYQTYKKRLEVLKDRRDELLFGGSLSQANSATISPSQSDTSFPFSTDAVRRSTEYKDPLASSGIAATVSTPSRRATAVQEANVYSTRRTNLHKLKQFAREVHEQNTQLRLLITLIDEDKVVAEAAPS